MKGGLMTWYQFGSVLPFLIILFCIAVLPLTAKTHHWWENNANKLIVSVSMGLIVVVGLLL